MSLRSLDRIWKTIGFRLTLWYSALFILSSLILFVIVYFLISSSFKQEERYTIQSKLREFSAQYQRGGIEALKSEVGFEAHSGNLFFVRMAGPQGHTLFVNIPALMGDGFDLRQIENSAPTDSGQWTHLPAKGDKGGVLDIASTRLPDGGILQVGMSRGEREEFLERFRETFAGIIIPVILLGFTGGVLFAFRALMPIRNIIKTVRSIDKGRLDARVSVRHTGDELEELTILFNGMLQRIEVLINGMRSALDNVAHDLRTPMTRLRGTAEMALRSGQDREVCREALSDCLEESDQILTMLNTLMDISEAETGVMRLRLEKINLSSLIEDVVDLYRYVAEERDIAIYIKTPGELFLTADHNRMRQVIANLLDNAVKYTPAGGRVEVEASRKGDHVIVRVEDTGIGISEEELPKIWGRLYRGEQSRSARGLGLGLSLVKAVVHAHKGYVEVYSEPDRGSGFIIYLPAKAA
ncbi:MAG: ATP-binding protein [Nitrospirota bacterium]|nr:ATP-binding protein [Nitrospirota bacterium]